MPVDDKLVSKEYEPKKNWNENGMTGGRIAVYSMLKSTKPKNPSA